MPRSRSMLGRRAHTSWSSAFCTIGNSFIRIPHEQHKHLLATNRCHGPPTDSGRAAITFATSLASTFAIAFPCAPEGAGASSEDQANQAMFSHPMRVILPSFLGSTFTSFGQHLSRTILCIGSTAHLPTAGIYNT